MDKESPKRLLQHFSKLYWEKVGEKYPPTWGRDIKLFNGMLELFDEDRLIKMLDLYFSMVRKIYSIPFFKVDLANLIQVVNKGIKEAPKKMEVSEQWRFE